MWMVIKLLTERLKELRLKAGYTQQQIADQLKVRRPTYTRYETGTNEPDKDTIVKLANIFNVSVDDLLGNEKSPAQKEPGELTFDDFTYAMYNESKELSGECKAKLLELAKFFKEQQDKERK
ncbi:hypothetical protein SDC9_100301 [bioreactor metagenome]|uniref:HTH cro/C1-type domain-containing protein n=1 Tax=bioreactor metagenome TaxID=1076179 RepID=A0A645ARN8_9ZZZZ